MPKYGIEQEETHVRVHVCTHVQRVYCYPTANGVDAINTGKYREAGATQPGANGAITGKGYLVPPFDIQGCMESKFDESVWQWADIPARGSTSLKGQRAAKLVKNLIKYGMLPLPSISEEVDDKDMQIKGCDILVKRELANVLVQVKCDYSGGDKALGGTGNLFLQTWEINPFGMH